MSDLRYLKVPIDFSRLNAGKRIHDLDFLDAIAQYIYSILITDTGELSFDHDFGTKVWEYDFTISSFTSEWKDSISKSIEHSIKKYVHQLDNIRVDVEISDEEFSDKIKNALRIKKKVTITIKGQLITTKQDYIFNQSLYLSPITVE